MNSRRQVRVSGRPVYGRAQPLGRVQRRRGVGRVRIGGTQWRLILLAVVVIAVAWGIGQILAVRHINVEAGERTAQVKEAAGKVVKESWQLGNMLTFDGGEFGSKLQQLDPAVKSVAVKRKWPQTIEVKAVLKQPSLAWTTGDQTYILDRDGTVIGNATPGMTLWVVNDGSNLPVQLGQRAASAHFVEFVGQMMPALEANGFKVTSLNIKDTTLDLTATTDKGYRILFDTSRGAGEEVADLMAVQRLLTSQNKTPAEYIDLRVAGKAYYK